MQRKFNYFIYVIILIFSTSCIKQHKSHVSTTVEVDQEFDDDHCYRLIPVTEDDIQYYSIRKCIYCPYSSVVELEGSGKSYTNIKATSVNNVNSACPTDPRYTDLSPRVGMILKGDLRQIPDSVFSKYLNIKAELIYFEKSYTSFERIKQKIKKDMYTEKDRHTSDETEFILNPNSYTIKKIEKKVGNKIKDIGFGYIKRGENYPQYIFRINENKLTDKFSEYIGLTTELMCNLTNLNEGASPEDNWSLVTDDQMMKLGEVIKMEHENMDIFEELTSRFPEQEYFRKFFTYDGTNYKIYTMSEHKIVEDSDQHRGVASILCKRKFDPKIYNLMN